MDVVCSNLQVARAAHVERCLHLTGAEERTILPGISVSPRTHLLILILLVGAATAAQTERLPLELKISDTEFASCYEETTGKLSGSRLVRTHFFVSPGGRYRAYVEVEAIASKSNTAPDSECASTSRLFVAAGDQSFRQVLVLEPTPDATGNTLTIVDWSPDGRTLLVDQGVFQWGSDVGRSSARLYDAETGTLSEPALVENAFSKRAGAPCASVIEPLGFSEYGQLVLKASPFFMLGEETPVEDSCLQQQGVWMLEPATQKLIPLPQDYKVQRYGRFEEMSIK